MSDKPSQRRFSSSEEMLAYLREHTDDIESVVIPVQPAIGSRDPDGRPAAVLRGVGALLNLCTGGSAILSRDDAAMLINDGVLQRLKIKCVLDTLE